MGNGKPKKKRRQQQSAPEQRTNEETTSSSENSGNTIKQQQQEQLGIDSIYDYYREQLFPALFSSFPILLQRLGRDSKLWLWTAGHGLVDFVLPKWRDVTTTTTTLPQIWQQQYLQFFSNVSSPSELMLRYFDTNGDGHISKSELLNMTEVLKAHFPVTAVTMGASSNTHFSWSAWFSREWPLMDWKIGVFLWRTFGGILLLVAILSIIPGRMHGWAARFLRWPVLGLTYFLIAVELAVYIVIRLFIRLAEYLIARPKHRKLRRSMAQAQNYDEWYQYAAQLDKSQGRDLWLHRVVDDDGTCRRYNWGFVLELIRDLRHARAHGDSLMALAVLQQCTRKNVGGVMSEDLFSYSNTGEPKHIVSEFVEEVAITIRWVTEEALGRGVSDPTDLATKKSYDQKLQKKVRKEKHKLWSSLLHATVSFLSPGDNSPQESEHELSTPERRRSDFDVASQRSSNGSLFLEASGHDLPACHRDEVLAFLKRARAAYGRTALCLSGGAMMGLYHFGHIQGLLETGMLPHIISGTSAGSVIAAIVCTRTDEELQRDLKPSVLAEKLTCFSRPWSERIKSVVRNGHMFSFDDWLKLIRWFACDDMTFEEAYRKTGRVFCITLSSTTRKAPPVLLNYLTAPNVTIASAVIASAAVPGFIPPVRLQYKDANGNVRTQTSKKDETYFDGSIRQDIPVNGLAEMLNCQFFIACQCNPHVVPFFFGNKGNVGRPSRWSSGVQESSWRGGFLLTSLEMYLKNDMKAKFRFLDELEAAVGFTSTMFHQEFVGSTTIVPQVSFWDYFKLFSDPKAEDLDRYFQAGCVAAYEHVAMIRLHYSIADVIDECVVQLQSGGTKSGIAKRRSHLDLTKSKKETNNGDNKTLRVPPEIIGTALRSGACEQSGTCDTDDVDDDDSFEDEYGRDLWIDFDAEPIS